KIFPLGAMPTLLAYGILLYWGIQKIGAGQITIGKFVALQSYVLMLQGPLFDMGDCIAEWQRGVASLRRIVEIFNLRPLGDRFRPASPSPSSPVPRLPVKEASRPSTIVDVQGLTFAYAQDQRPVLHAIALTVAAGECIGIAGPIGSGKST